MDESFTQAGLPSRATRTTPPAGSTLAYVFADAYYSDCFVREITPGQCDSAYDAYLQMTTAAPGWINFLLNTRDKLVGWLGMTPTLGFKQEANESRAMLKPADKLDFFEVVTHEQGELVLQLLDRHFKVSISLYLDQRNEHPKLFVTSVVIPHGQIGKLYLKLIAPFHRRIVKTMLGSLT